MTILRHKNTEPNPLVTMRLRKRSFYILVCLLINSILFFIGCDDNQSETIPSANADSFTFLTLGADSRYSGSLRDQLRDSLGPDAMVKRTPIDLAINYPKFIETYFKPIHQFNLLLNDDRGARVEHDTVKLIYRYPQKKSRLFKTVQLLFSGQSRKPLFFNIISRKEGGGILDTMRQKYGEPKEITWSHQPGQSYFWQNDMDYLIVSRVLDRFGDPEYRIAIYYGANIDELIKWEQRQIQQREDKRKKAGQTAF